MLMPYILALLLLLISFLIPKPVDAQRGCCSWHGGISHCDGGSGRYICNDGTYSPTCTCGYNPPVSRNVYTAPEFPQMEATWNFDATPEGTYNISVELNDSFPSSYSVALSQDPGADPGPYADFTEPTFSLVGVYPGTYYMNVKKRINGAWSTVAYWTIEVPEWSPPEPTITTAIVDETASEGSQQDTDWIIYSLLAIGGLGGLELIRNAVFSGKSKK